MALGSKARFYAADPGKLASCLGSLRLARFYACSRPRKASIVQPSKQLVKLYIKLLPQPFPCHPQLLAVQHRSSLSRLTTNAHRLGLGLALRLCNTFIITGSSNPSLRHCLRSNFSFCLWQSRLWLRFRARQFRACLQGEALHGPGMVGSWLKLRGRRVWSWGWVEACASLDWSVSVNN